jgi:hypothetical protein
LNPVLGEENYLILIMCCSYFGNKSKQQRSHLNSSSACLTTDWVLDMSFKKQNDLNYFRLCQHMTIWLETSKIFWFRYYTNEYAYTTSKSSRKFLHMKSYRWGGLIHTKNLAVQTPSMDEVHLSYTSMKRRNEKTHKDTWQLLVTVWLSR